MDGARHSLDRLEILSPSEHDEAQRDVLRCIVDLYFITLDQQQASDTDAFCEFMERVAYRLDASGRAELSDRIAEASPAPQELILRLATDEIAVARPVLTRSSCLRDEDLIGIMRSRGRDHMAAIAERSRLSEAVTDVIVEKGSKQIVTDMVQNSGAEFSERTFNRLAECAASAADLVEVLLAREDLPDSVMARVRSAAVEQVSPERQGKNGRGSGSGSAVNEGVLVRFAKTGRPAAAARCLSVMTGLDAAMLEHFLLEADLSMLIVICKAHRLERATFASLYHLRIASGSPGSGSFASAMRRYHAMELRKAELLFRMLKDQTSSSTRQQAVTDGAHVNIR